MPKPITVFIIDDDEDDREMFCEAMANISEASVCMTAFNGQEALQKLQNAHTLPDFIFLDLNMPRMNGKQCLVQLKKDKRLATIPVVIYSTSKREDDRAETKELGSVHFITKPTSITQLRKDLQFVFDRKYENPGSV